MWQVRILYHMRSDVSICTTARPTYRFTEASNFVRPAQGQHNIGTVFQNSCEDSAIKAVCLFTGFIFERYATKRMWSCRTLVLENVLEVRERETVRVVRERLPWK